MNVKIHMDHVMKVDYTIIHQFSRITKYINFSLPKAKLLTQGPELEQIF